MPKPVEPEPDVVFEVTGSTAGAEMMTKLLRVRGRVVVVAVFGDPPKVDLFQFFWREIAIVRRPQVCEPEDFREKRSRSAKRPGALLGIERLITNVRASRRAWSRRSGNWKGGMLP